MYCAFCEYTKSCNPLPCDRDSSCTDSWVCKHCSKMKRPYTFTPRTTSLELWGDDHPYLGQASGQLSQYPTGPHRKFAFHNRCLQHSCLRQFRYGSRLCLIQLSSQRYISKEKKRRLSKRMFYWQLAKRATFEVRWCRRIET